MDETINKQFWGTGLTLFSGKTGPLKPEVVVVTHNPFAQQQICS